MDYGDETGSEDTSATDEDEAPGLDDDLEHETGESEEGWQDEDEEGEEGLVENDEVNGDEDDDDDEDEGDDDGDDGVMWQVCFPCTLLWATLNWSLHTGCSCW